MSVSCLDSHPQNITIDAIPECPSEKVVDLVEMTGLKRNVSDGCWRLLKLVSFGTMRLGHQ